MNTTNINNFLSLISQQLTTLKPDIITKLPSEIIINIIVNLDVPEIVQARQICKRFLKIIDDDKGVLIKKIEGYKKLYIPQKQTNNLVVNDYKKRFNQWLEFLPITETSLKHNTYIVDKFKIHGQYYCLTKLFNNNKYKFTEIKQITIDQCFQNEVPYKQRFFYKFYATNDENVFFITTTDQSYLLVSMLDTTVEALYGRVSNNLYTLNANIILPSLIKNFLLIDDFIVYVANINYPYILKKINGVYTNLLILNLVGPQRVLCICYLGKTNGNINFLIHINKSLLIYEENKKVAYSENKQENNYWQISEIFKTEENLSVFSENAIITTSENGLVFIKEHPSYNPNDMIHIYRYSRKITTISLTDEEKQNECFFGDVLACNNSGTSFIVKKMTQDRSSYFSVYKIDQNTIVHSYTIVDTGINTITDIQYSPCGNFIEVTHKKNSEYSRINIYNIAHKEKCIEFRINVNTFNNTGFLHALVIENKIVISCCINQKIEEKTTITCTNTVLKVTFSPNSQLVAAMEINMYGKISIRVYRIFKLQQDDTIKFAPINIGLSTEVFAEINTDGIVDFKFHPDGFKIIVITSKIIKIFCLTAINKASKIKML